MRKLPLLILLIALFPFLAFNLYSLDKCYFLCPISYKGDVIVRSDYRGNGYFASPRSGRRLHQGIDLLAPLGTPVMAARSGRVIFAKARKGMGNYVVIRHKNGIVTIYGHLDKIYTRAGAFVRQGDIIGSVGKTGNARYRGIESHLHFEVRKNNKAVDPLNYL